MSRSKNAGPYTRDGASSSYLSHCLFVFVFFFSPLKGSFKCMTVTLNQLPIKSEASVPFEKEQEF